MITEHECRTRIQGFYRTVAQGDAQKAMEYCTEEVTLTWGAFKFNGKEALKHWVKELRQSFRGIVFVEKQILVGSDKVTHLFVFRIVTPMGGIGLMPATGTYLFQKDRFQQLDIKLQDGVILTH